MGEARDLLASRRKAYKVQSHNFQFRFLLYQGLLDYAAVHALVRELGDSDKEDVDMEARGELCGEIEREVRLWIDEDGIDNVDDIKTGDIIKRDASKQLNFIGVGSGTGATHSRHRGGEKENQGVMSGRGGGKGGKK